jgi:hypothetical protein
MSAAAAVRAARPLVVCTVFFGPLPPWLPITLHSMAANDRVDFIVVGDAPPPSVLPPNVRFETIAYTAMQARLTQLTGRSVVYTNTYKANDIKPLLPALYPEAIRGYEWWGWADLDVIFGDLLKFVELALAQPACCRGLEYGCTKRAWRDPRSPCFNSSRGREPADTYGDRDSCRCREGERVTAISPLYPNPWRKKCWGPFTLFRVSAGARLFEETPKWRAALATAEYTHFDEWWGPFVQQGFESMGDVMTRLSDEGRLVMSRARLPFSEAKSCVDIECTFCPCGATRFVLRGRTLTVNDEESMILHLAEAKPAWLTLAANAAAGAGGSAGWRVPAYAPGQPSCFEVSHLGLYAADAALRAVGSAMLHAATRYERHRPVSDHAAAALVYPKHNATAGGGLDPKASQVKAVGSPRLSVLPCTLDRLEASHAAAGPGDGTHSRGSSGGGGGGGSGNGGVMVAAAAVTPGTTPDALTRRTGHATPGALTALTALTAARAALRDLHARYDAYTGAERLRTLAWLCAWERLSTDYNESLEGVDLSAQGARRLPLLFGNRRVRFGLYGGERVGWWRQTVNTSVAAEEGPVPALRPDRCALAGACGGACGAQPMPCAVRSAPMCVLCSASGARQGRKRAGRAPLRIHGRRLKARRATVYDLKGPPIKGVPCLPEVVEDDPLDGRTDSGAQDGASPTEVQSRLAEVQSRLAEVQERIFDAYLQLQKVQRDERARTRRWMCSWLYKLKACDDAEALQRRLGRRPSEGPPEGAVLGVSTRLVALAAPVTTRRCRRIAPPDHAVSTGDPALGWGGLHVPQLNSTAMNALLFRFRCW